ncbi:hypothetical protein [Sediminimonas qiaohouensis]|uniref:hypothetical protein n=1 Tax=Sediminimonas qiaohouensis TaxID=552061 RepID=UPI000412FC2D|nr:hypothetical protein [Sediminimonas qiaohouensis]
MYRLEFMDQNAMRFQEAVGVLGSSAKAHKAFRRAINHTGGKAHTQVRRTLAKQMGLTQKRLRQLGALQTRRANYHALEYTITGSGKELSLKEFGAKQFKFGVRARPWGQTRRYPGAFIFAGNWRSGQPVAYGHVFKRRGGFSEKSGRNNAIEKMWGPSVPKELVRDASVKAFETTAKDLGPRIRHEMSRLTDGVIG